MILDPTVSPSALSLDHPGWLPDHRGRARRAFATGDVVWAVRAPIAARLDLVIEHPQRGVATSVPVADWFDTAILPTFFHAAKPIREGIRICRIRNPNLWDAFLPPVLHQRRSTKDARHRYRLLCANHGRVVSTTVGPALLPPTPEAIATLPDDAFIALGLRDKINPLRSVANGYLKHADRWARLSPRELFIELQKIEHVGAATADVAVADTTNDYRFRVIPQRVFYRHWQKIVTAPNSDAGEQEFVEELAKLSPCQRATLIVAVQAALARGRRRPRHKIPTTASCFL